MKRSETTWKLDVAMLPSSPGGWTLKDLKIYIWMKRMLAITMWVVAPMSALASHEVAMPDTVHHIQEVVVTSRLISRETIPSQTLAGEELKKLNTLSVADALRYFSGLQLKDYGGVGGIKTVNIRSMGTNHLGIFYDGIELGNAQNGQIDLGQF